jgi:hypothetical protein
VHETHVFHARMGRKHASRASRVAPCFLGGSRISGRLGPSARGRAEGPRGRCCAAGCRPFKCLKSVIMCIYVCACVLAFFAFYVTSHASCIMHHVSCAYHFYGCSHSLTHSLSHTLTHSLTLTLNHIIFHTPTHTHNTWSIICHVVFSRTTELELRAVLPRTTILTHA